nr:hypothetical protein [Mangrovactinospora gilvigrisea]
MPAAGAEAGAEASRGAPRGAPPERMWHVTLSMAGDPVPVTQLRRALETLVNEHPPLMTGRYAADRAEIRYWEEAAELQDAAALALRLWGEYRSRAGLPAWRTVGLEVVDRHTYRQRVEEGRGPNPAVGADPVRPF